MLTLWSDHENVVLVVSRTLSNQGHIKPCSESSQFKFLNTCREWLSSADLLVSEGLHFMLDVAVGNRAVKQFLDHGLEVGQGVNRR
jgi:hypothetical protein